MVKIPLGAHVLYNILKNLKTAFSRKIYPLKPTFLANVPNLGGGGPANFGEKIL